MSTDTHSRGRFPTTGPAPETYERYRFVATTSEEALIYDVEREDRWIQAEAAISLEDWR